MDLTEATINDLKLLAKMNIRLRHDEQIDNTMTDLEVENRMKDYLEGNIYKTYLLKEDNTVFGYALLDITRKPVYLKQLFIDDEYRKKGYGKFLINKIIDRLSLDEIDLEVMVWNDNAKRFYENFGFRPRYLGLRYKRENGT